MTLERIVTFLLAENCLLREALVRVRLTNGDLERSDAVASRSSLLGAAPTLAVTRGRGQREERRLRSNDGRPHDQLSPPYHVIRGPAVDGCYRPRRQDRRLHPMGCRCLTKKAPGRSDGWDLRY